MPYQEKWLPRPGAAPPVATSLVLPLKRDLPIKKKKKRKLDSSEGTKEVNHCWDLCLLKQIQARIWHDSEFRHELLKSSERWSARAEDVGSLQVSLDKLQGDDASAALADFDVENEMHDVEDGLLFRRHPRLGREGAIYAPSLSRCERHSLACEHARWKWSLLRSSQHCFPPKQGRKEAPSSNASSCSEPQGWLR